MKIVKTKVVMTDSIEAVEIDKILLQSIEEIYLQIDLVDKDLLDINLGIKFRKDSSLFAITAGEHKSKWPKVSTIRQLDCAVRCLKRNFAVADKIHETIISENYRIERATIKSRMDEIGIPNESFAVDFDAQAQLKIEPGCRVMYELCKADTVVQIQQNIKIATLEEAVAELYNCIQLAYVLINDDDERLNTIERSLLDGSVQKLQKSQKKLEKAVKNQRQAIASEIKLVLFLATLTAIVLCIIIITAFTM